MISIKVCYISHIRVSQSPLAAQLLDLLGGDVFAIKSGDSAGARASGEHIGDGAEEVALAHAAAHDEGHHAQDSQTGKEDLLMFSKGTKRIESHYPTSSYGDSPGRRIRPGLDTLQKDVVWVDGGFRPK